MAKHSFEDFYRIEYPRLAGSLRLVANGDSELAQDVAQEAFSRALNHWGKLQSYDRPAGWVYRTAFNLLRRYWREEVFLAAPESMTIEREPGDRIDLVRFLSMLSAHEREAIVLRYVLDHTSKEVAQILGVSDGSLRMTLHRSLLVLKERANVDLDPEVHSEEAVKARKGVQ